VEAGALDAITLTIRLAVVTVGLLMVVGTPLAWWIAFTRSRLKPLVEAVVALPLVLPPTVLGFYLLILLGPAGGPGRWFAEATGSSLAFSFSGLVIASMLYSLPFVVQPTAQALQAMGRGPLEAAETLGAGPVDRFFTVALPLARRGFVTAAVLGFAHTLGEFGVILMVGGNIPGRTQVLSIKIYESVETLDYATAHGLSAGLLAFSFAVLTVVYWLNRGTGVGLFRQ
jgi:molybdate transport system permease protein